MPSKKKKFIDKKNAVTFQLVHRSQRDPLAADERAPQRVLLQSVSKKKVEEQQKFGIYFDDDYDYLQHLKDVNEVAEWEPIVSRTRLSAAEAGASIPNPVQAFKLPSSVFQSNVEEKEGLLNKAATVKGPRPDFDPDVIAALDEDFDFDNPENELEDDFMQLANAEGDKSDDDEDYTDVDSDEDDDAMSHDFKGYCSDNDSDDGQKSRFTSYSMTSSVLPRSEILQTLDDRFEKLYEEYDEEEIGALDGEEINGFIDPNSDIIKQLLNDHEKNFKTRPTLGQVLDDKEDCADVEVPYNIEDENLIDLELLEKPGRNDENKWDCESILSTYSNLYNRPKLIKEAVKPKLVKLNQRTGIPEDVLLAGKNQLTKKTLKILSQEMEDESQPDDTRSMLSKRSAALSVRDRNETPEQRKERKVAVKELRRERRLEKKANKEAFKEEEIRQSKVMKNLKQNLQGIKIV